MTKGTLRKCIVMNSNPLAFIIVSVETAIHPESQK